MSLYHVFGIIVIGYGLSIVLRARARGSKARMLNGLALVPVGASQFFRETPWLATTLIVFGLILFVWSMALIRREMRSRNQ